MTVLLKIDDLSKSYSTDQGLSHVSLDLQKGEKLSLLGASGSGKSTLLRLIAGLETPDSGRIEFNGKSMIDILPHKRNIGMMFQDFALFPHMNVYDNIAFGLKMKKMKTVDIKNRVNDMLMLTRMAGFEYRNVEDLSGGEQQRVALARTLAPEPDLLLLDEPLSALDRHLREDLLAELIAIIDQLHLTTLFVTHDHDEAFAIGDYVAVVDKGRIIQQGTRQELLHHPANDRVKEFFKHYRE